VTTFLTLPFLSRNSLLGRLLIGEVNLILGAALLGRKGGQRTLPGLLGVGRKVDHQSIERRGLDLYSECQREKRKSSTSATHPVGNPNRPQLELGIGLEVIVINRTLSDESSDLLHTLGRLVLAAKAVGEGVSLFCGF
jgi:hypothetical protein